MEENYSDIALTAAELLKQSKFEDAIEKYSEAFRIKELLAYKGMLTFFYPFKNVKFSVGDMRDLSRLQHFFRKSDKTFINLIALNYLTFREKVSLKFLNEYSGFGAKTLEQHVLIALMFDALNQESSADDIYLDIYNKIKNNKSFQLGTIQTRKGKVYAVASKKLLKNIFLFKEYETYKEASFEAECSSLINNLIKDEPNFSVSSIRHPIKDVQSNKYINIIKRERCITLDNVANNLDETLKESVRFLALIHSRLDKKDMQQVTLDNLILKLNYDANIKSILMKNKTPIEASLTGIPLAYHKDAHPLNYGIKEDKTLILFDCENKGLRPVTSDLAKLLLLHPLINKSLIKNQLDNYVRLYNLYSEHCKIHDLQLPFLNASIELVFSYPSTLTEHRIFDDRMKKHLLDVSLFSIGAIKENFNDFYEAYSRQYENIESVINVLYA